MDSTRTLTRLAVALLVLLVAARGTAANQAAPAEGSEASLRDWSDFLRLGLDATEAEQLHERIFLARGISNTAMVVTDEGNVVIDTSLAMVARRHKKLLKAANAGPVRYIVLTHSHPDHTGGLAVWREPDTKVIAQENCRELLHYQARLAPFFARRNSAQFGFPLRANAPNGNYGATIAATETFEKKYEFQLGGIRFELHHTPGETDDHLSIWIPQLKTAFVGDNYYASFPNLYTLRGTKPRWALDYVKSLNRVLSWKPELVVSGHGRPLQGREEITAELTRYRDAILFVHDATVRGMNQGKSVHQLMREITLPPELQLPEIYGTVAWSVRGIYEGYAGWFDEEPASMYAVPASDVYAELVQLAGGADNIARRAAELVANGQLIEGLHLANMAVDADPGNLPALKTRLAALEAMAEESTNMLQRGWLRHGIRTTTKQIRQAEKDAG